MIVTVMFKAYVFHDIEVPENWEPTPENVEKIRDQAWEEVDLDVSRNYWDAETLNFGNESIELN